MWHSLSVWSEHRSSFDCTKSTLHFHGAHTLRIVFSAEVCDLQHLAICFSISLREDYFVLVFFLTSLKVNSILPVSGLNPVWLRALSPSQGLAVPLTVTRKAGRLSVFEQRLFSPLPFSGPLHNNNNMQKPLIHLLLPVEWKNLYLTHLMYSQSLTSVAGQ